ncbi:(deoxy)nucleoside triphosphate pyrophosphohydrolase [Ferrimonas balearica]|uniref:(deoxy)nucleoside triphosphate pyrophosphohydrolase n=1 Tax=Ferrimonas balearica TaxID=44012 RepID=UPI001C990130|nr:(deoxy)nucleoside triphosphate pyrophosphohydrolase [Ferrimonas balearica]MBY5922893.1 (deoxy)nucleoside triphosphate pyrophosphohydrolase [Ferrimonas balearica]MBY5997730.1 (deoxy)nucleoside triphosphate pyrophosphohydrolase [Ferrimonas balearica]
MSQSPIEVVAALLIHQDQLLIARRHPERDQSGWWEFPGGKVESNETHEGALSRELFEELGIRVTVLERVATHTHDYGDKVVRLHGYRCQWTPQPITLTDSHDAIEWLAPEAVEMDSLAPADRPLLQALLS